MARLPLATRDALTRPRAQEVPIYRQNFNSFEYPGFGFDPELAARQPPAPTTPTPTTPAGGGSTAPAQTRAVYDVRRQPPTERDPTGPERDRAQTGTIDSFEDFARSVMFGAGLLSPVGAAMVPASLVAQDVLEAPAPVDPTLYAIDQIWGTNYSGANPPEATKPTEPTGRTTTSEIVDPQAKEKFARTQVIDRPAPAPTQPATAKNPEARAGQPDRGFGRAAKEDGSTDFGRSGQSLSQKRDSSIASRSSGGFGSKESRSSGNRSGSGFGGKESADRGRDRGGRDRGGKDKGGGRGSDGGGRGGGGKGKA